REERGGVCLARRQLADAARARRVLVGDHEAAPVAVEVIDERPFTANERAPSSVRAAAVSSSRQVLSAASRSACSTLPLGERTASGSAFFAASRSWRR